MGSLIDLDSLAERVRELSTGWQKSATVSPLTWRDEDATWPQPIVEDRALVSSPESLGFGVTTSAGELRMVAWIGGWFDVDMLKNGEDLPRYAEFTNLEEAVAFIAETVNQFLR
jgi:hypothetical protein